MDAKLDGCLYGFLAVVAIGLLAIGTLGEWVILALGALVAIALVALVVWGGMAVYMWTWRQVALTRVEIESKRQNLAIQAAQARSQLMIDDRRAQLVYALDGALPVSHNAVISGEYDRHLLELSARRIETLAPVANVPHSLTYAPHISQRGEVAALPEVMANTFVAPATDFFQLFMGGKLPKDKFLVGTSLEDGSEVLATWQNLYSALIGGMSGSGKSTLIRSLLAQSALQGGKFVVIDPHFGAGDESLGHSLQPLKNLMLCDVASNDKEMSSALKYVADIGKRRLSGQDTDKTPVVLVVDETTGILQRGNVAAQLIDVLGMISQETRKVGLYAFCIGQNFSGQVLPTEVRNSFVSFISCRARKDVARVQSGSNSFGRLAEELTIGQAVWMTPSGDVHRVSVPNCTETHLKQIASNLTVGSASQPTSEVLPAYFQEPGINGSGSMLEVVRKYPGSTPEAHKTLSADDKMIVEMFKGGASRRQIIMQIFGVTGGRKYEEATDCIESAIRKAMA